MSTRSGRVRASIAETSPSRRRKVASPSRSPARNRKQSSDRRSRQSPAKKSPGRKSASKYPARKSPSRIVKDKAESKNLTKSPAKRPPIYNTPQVKLEDFSTNLETFRSTRSKRTEYTVKDIPINSIEDDLNGLDSTDSSEYSLKNRRSVDIAPRRSSRLQEFVDNVPDIRRSISKSLSKSISKTIDTYSDDESDLTFRGKSTSVVRQLSTPFPSTVSLAQVNNKFEFGGIFGALSLTLIIPLIAIGITAVCSKKCSHNMLIDLVEYKNTTWFTVLSLEFILVQNILQAGILMLPLLGSKEVDGQGKRYSFNAFFTSLITLSLLFALNFYKVFNIDIILESHLQLGVVSYLIALVLSICLYIKSRKINENDLNPYGHSKYAFYNFFIGREVHPQINKFNIKLWTYRVCNITTLTLLVLIFKQSFNFEINDLVSLKDYRELLSKAQFRPTLAVFTAMQIIYTLYFIMFEHRVASTFYWQYEGLGYMQLTASALYPFYFTSISKYLADSGLHLRQNTLIAASALFVFGFVLMFVSNDTKHRFRKNPLEPAMLHLESMPTFHGKKLLLSGSWGFVRHPNYLGDIIVHLALALPGALSSRPVAALPALLPIVVLMHRAWRDHCRCRRRYGAAWQRYCKRVPSLLLPKVL